MANTNTKGFGLIPAGTLGQTPATAGLGKYKIDAGSATTLYNGGAVASNAGYIVDGQTTDAPIIGVLNGVFFTDPSTLKPTFKNFYQQVTPANSEDIDAFVYDNPQQQYVVATDDAVTQAGFLETYDMNTSSGSDTTGKSNATLDMFRTFPPHEKSSTPCVLIISLPYVHELFALIETMPCIDFRVNSSYETDCIEKLSIPPSP